MKVVATGVESMRGGWRAWLGLAVALMLVAGESGMAWAQAHPGVVKRATALQRSDIRLRDEVVAAVRDGRFAVHAVADVDEAMRLLTGRADVDAAVRARLAEFGKLRQKILAPAPRNRQSRH